MKYLYILDSASGLRNPIEFEAESNLVLAWRKAGQEFGLNGRLFQEVRPQQEAVGFPMIINEAIPAGRPRRFFDH